MLHGPRLLLTAPSLDMVRPNTLTLLLAAMLCSTLAPLTCQAQSAPAARSFVDLDDTSDAASDNAAASKAGGGASPAIQQQCLRGLNPTGNSASVMLKAQMGSYRIFNPDTNAFDTVNLRSYNGCPTGPTISVKHGATLNVTLNNALPADPEATCASVADHTTPHCFNHTNLHTHGLHVSPSGSSDNVLLSVPPGATQKYAYQLPSNHPSGTFWYHAHLHGSTAIDVSSGMAGVLIVRGTRAARAGVADGSADIDTILTRAGGKQPMREHVMLFQQIEYGCFDSPTSDVPLVDPLTHQWTCPKGAVGEIRGYDKQLTFAADPRPAHIGQFNTTWAISGRYTQINGEVQPVYPSATSFIPAGEVRRWRMVHGGNRDTINVKIVRANLAALGQADSPSVTQAQVDKAAGSFTALLGRNKSALGQTTTLDAVCGGETVKQLEFAEDGLTMQSMIEKDVNTLNPGYRSDVLVAFPSPGLYCILDEAGQAAATISFRPKSGAVKDRRLLGIARVGQGVTIPSTTLGSHSKYWQYIRNQLVEANPALPEPAKTDLASLDLRAFAPRIPVDVTPDNQVSVTFDVTPNAANPGAFRFVINGETYDPSLIPFKGVLGNVDQWIINATAAGGHVFHIHVNPFRVMDIRNPAGNSIFDPSGGCTAAELATGDTEYCGMKDVIRDTFFVKPGYKLVMRTAYQDFTGEFVMHCHILDHEDQGMMANVAVVSPATALLQRMTDPIASTSRQALRWVEARDGKKQRELDAALSSICSAN